MTFNFFYVLTKAFCFQLIEQNGKRKETSRENTQTIQEIEKRKNERKSIRRTCIEMFLGATFSD
jgi:hypothetical protein